MGYQIERKMTTEPNQALIISPKNRPYSQSNTRGSIILTKFKDQFNKYKSEITQENERKMGDRVINDELQQVVTTYNNNQSELFKDLFGTREIIQIQSPQMQGNYN